MLEVLVALTCTGLLAAGVLSLLVDGAGTVRARVRQVDAESRARDAVLAVDLLLRDAGASLEGARAIDLEGERIPVVELGVDRLRAVIATGGAREAEPESGGWLRLADVSGWRPADLVVALGVGPTGHESVPAGRLAEVRRDRPRGSSPGSVRVTWSPSEAAALSIEGEPRALVRVVLRQFAVRPGAFGLELRRRDLGGRWQPVADGLTALSYRALDPAGASAPPSGALLEIEVRAPARGAPDVRLLHRLRLR